jgi:hypothetical protein
VSTDKLINCTEKSKIAKQKINNVHRQIKNGFIWANNI